MQWMRSRTYLVKQTENHDRSNIQFCFIQNDILSLRLIERSIKIYRNFSSILSLDTVCTKNTKLKDVGECIQGRRNIITLIKSCHQSMSVIVNNTCIFYYTPHEVYTARKIWINQIKLDGFCIVE